MHHGTDVLVVGGGLAGCIAATSLLRAGISVRVIDRHHEPLDDFRAEQIVGRQVDKLRRLGLLAPLALRANVTRITGNYQRGALLDHTHVEQYGLSYQAMVSAVRSTLPLGCLVTARVAAIETSPTIQTVHLANGDPMSARLAVLATGLMPQVAKGLGIGWDMKSEAHSLCLGFGVDFDHPGSADRVPFTYYRETIDDRIDYLTLFRMNGGVRANLFCYNRREDPWIRRFLDEPDATLQSAMPGLHKAIGPMTIARPIEVRRNDLRVATNVERDGIVLVGDAFQTPCPAIGNGIDRILSDVETLERLIPSWLATPGSGADKIAQFYADPVKRAFDAECLRAAHYRRDLSTNDSLGWTLHRVRVDLQRRIGRTIRPTLRRTPIGAAMSHEAVDR